MKTYFLTINQEPILNNKERERLCRVSPYIFLAFLATFESYSSFFHFNYYSVVKLIVL